MEVAIDPAQMEKEKNTHELSPRALVPLVFVLTKLTAMTGLERENHVEMSFGELLTSSQHV